MPDHSSIPSLTSLMQESRRVPPLSRAAFEQRHLGRQICWQLVFATAVPIGQSALYQVLATQRTFWMRFGCSAFFRVDPDLYPSLLNVLPGRRLRVCGSIRAFKTDSVTLHAESVEVMAKFFDRYRY